MQVHPSFDFLQWEQNVDVVIYLIPTEPVKSYEFKLSFDPDHLQILSVETGDFFEGWQTFFSTGVIDNTNGTLINVYQLIIGQGNTTDPGSLVVIHCHTEDIGLTPLHLYDMGITNETKYLQLTVQDGAIQVYGEYYPWDCNEDYHCNYLDLSIVASHYMNHCPPGDEVWDIIEDGVCNYLDLSALVAHLYT